MSAPVFIVYRHTDSQHATDRIYSRLAPRHLAATDISTGKAPLVKDEKLTDAIRREVRAAKVCVVVIGPICINQLDPHGRRRLDDPGDIVRVAVSEAVARGITIIPVLVENARMPTAAELPATMKPLSGLKPVAISKDRFERDVDTLAGAILEAMGRRVDLDMDLVKLLFSFHGSVGRRPFWVGILLVFLAQILVIATTLYAFGIDILAGEAIKLTRSQRLVLQIASAWVWWPILALTWKRVRNSGHSWELFLPVAAITGVQLVFELTGFHRTAMLLSFVCLLLLLVLGTMSDRPQVGPAGRHRSPTR